MQFLIICGHLCAQYGIVPVVMHRSNLRLRYGQALHAEAVSLSLCFRIDWQGNVLSAAQRNIYAVSRRICKK